LFSRFYGDKVMIKQVEQHRYGKLISSTYTFAPKDIRNMAEMLQVAEVHYEEARVVERYRNGDSEEFYYVATGSMNNVLPIGPAT
jgi:hypothetical protein